MSEQVKAKGGCQCGAIRFELAERPKEYGACHCKMCRKLGGGVALTVMVPPNGATWQGEEHLKTYASSQWAERGFCGTCGSTLWYGTVQDGVRNLAAGLFENAGGAPLKLEFFVDQCPQGYALVGDHKKLTTQETIALFAPTEE